MEMKSSQGVVTEVPVAYRLSKSRKGNPIQAEKEIQNKSNEN